MSMNVTDRWLAEERLRAAEARYHTLFEAMDAGFCVIEVKFDGEDRAIDYLHVEVNSAFERQTGRTDLLGAWALEAMPGLERYWVELYGGVARTGRPVRVENYVEPLQRWLDIHAFPAGDGENRVAILFSDVSERKRAEDQLCKLNETLEAQVAERTAELRFHRDIIEATISPDAVSPTATCLRQVQEAQAVVELSSRLRATQPGRLSVSLCRFRG